MKTIMEIKPKLQEYYTPEDFQRFYEVYKNPKSLGLRTYLIEKFIYHVPHGSKKINDTPKCTGQHYNLSISLKKLRKIYNSAMSVPNHYYCIDNIRSEMSKEALECFRVIAEHIKKTNLKIKICRFHDEQNDEFNLLFYFIPGTLPGQAFSNFEQYKRMYKNAPWMPEVLAQVKQDKDKTI